MRHLVIALVLLPSLAHAQKKWTPIGATSSGNQVFVDPKSVKRTGSLVAATVRVAGDRVGIRGGEDLRRDLVLDGVEVVEFLALGQAGGRERDPEEVRIDALILPIEQGFI